MSDSGQERTEQATPKKREESHRKGEVPRSQELTTAAVLLASAAVFRFAGPRVADAIGSVFHYAMTLFMAPAASIHDAAAWLHHVGRLVALGTAPILVGLAIISVGVNVVQARGVLSVQAMSPKWSRLSPMQNMKRIFGVRSVMELLKSLLKLVVVGSAMYFVMSGAWPEIMSLPQRPPAAVAYGVTGWISRLLLAAGIAYIALAGLDYAFQVWNHEKQMRMTREEVKRETKESEGDPLVKSRLRTLGRSLLRRQMFNDVPSADVVITNPTRIAVALKYDPKTGGAPMVLAMGQRKIAERIRRIARESGVPIIENVPVARALLATGRVGMPIPSDLYVAVAEILAFVIRRRAAAGRAWAGSGSA